MPNISEFAVKRWQFTLVVFGMLLALGVSSLVAIPKSEDPTFPLPVFVVVAVLPGASPLDLEQLVVDPIEERVQALDDLDRVETTIRDGLAVIRVEYEAGVDVPRKEDELRRELDTLRPTLPSELVRLDLETANAANVNIVQVGLVSDDVSYADLDRLARALEDRLEAVPGVGEATIAGLPAQELRIELDLGRMRALGISPAEILGAVSAESRTIPAGSVEAGARRFTVQTRGDYESVDAVRDTVVRASAGRMVRVRDVANVTFGDAEAVHLVRVNGRRAVTVAVNQREGQNIFTVRNGIEEALAAFEPTLPEGVTLARTFDQSHNVEHRLSGFARDFVLAILLVLVTLLPLGVRASVVVMISIPLSIAVGLTMLFGAGYGINQLSIVGFVIALGLLVDDSVVVVENIARFLRLGHTPREAAILATKQITLSVLGCTATLILAFVPLLALPGTAGEFIRSLPLAVVLTVAASLLVSLTVVPFLASRVLKPEEEHGNVVFRGMMRVIEGSYRPVLSVALRWPKLTLVAAVALFVGSIALVPRIGFSLFPKAGTAQFLVRVETEEGASLAETDRATRFVERVLASHDEIAWQVANVGKGNPLVYYNVPVQNERANVGEVFASLAHFDPDHSPALLDRLREELGSYPGARIRLLEFENGPPLEAPIAMRLMGDDVESLADAAARIETVLAATPGTRDVVNPARERRTDLRVRVDETRAAALGVVAAEIDRAVRLAIGGVPAGRFRHPGDDDARDIRVMLARDEAPDLALGASRPTLATLAQVFVPTRDGGAVPLSAIATIELEPSPTTIRHYDGIRSATVTAFTRTGENTDRVTRDVLSRLSGVPLPSGVRLVVAGEVESRARSFGGLGTAIIVAAFGILAVLVLEFRTFRGTLIVASVIPLGVIGGLVALLVTGNTLSFTAMIGFVALMGIEVKNSILLVDFTNQLREEGASLDDAIQRAGETRFVPILLTTLTAIGGLVPLALERSPLYSPLAWVILGGLVSSTLLARIVTPVMYKLLPPTIGEDEESVLAPIAAIEPEPIAAE
ncbi:efflux RND transporter permease subunit [Sandaracinus amylolyticus]|uniref:RND multidrug efflux transporter n=1 Tax=Sandaracinus amylolyticus TaxID=927083 RepID=A0A0F6W7A8_9BACT|nr:efflux RND transporter permease subunit [Sandaracinus amylolyticus]AKF09318.1 RND multidrug efflux transporter [Sandaracinus amylolyticus]